MISSCIGGKVTRACAAAAVLALALTACGSSDDKSSGGAAADKIVFGIDHLTSITNAASVIGAQDHVCKSVGVDARTAAPGAGGNSIHALLSGSIDVALSSMSSITGAFTKDANLVVIGGDSTGTNGMAWLALPDSPLSSVQDLKGKKVSVSSAGSNTETILTHILRTNSVTDTKTVYIADAPSGLAALASGSADATWATEPTVTQLVNEKKAKIIFKADDFIKDFQLTLAVVRKDWAQKNPEKVKKVLDCLHAERDYLGDNVDRVAKDFAASAKTDPEVVAEVLKAELDAGFLTINIDVAGVEEALNELVAAGALPKSTTLESFKGLFEVPKGSPVQVLNGTLP